jgi:hypothetical protein
MSARKNTVKYDERECLGDTPLFTNIPKPSPFLSRILQKNADRQPQCEMQDEGKEAAYNETVVDIDKLISSGYSQTQ